MNYFHQLSTFYSISTYNKKITSNHVSLYLALLYVWNKNFFISPIDIYRDTILSLSKIGSTHTYYKCIKDLHNWSFVRYLPSSNGIIASTVYVFELNEESITKIFVCLCNIDTSNAQALTQALSKISTSNALVLHPFINNYNIKRNETINNKVSPNSKPQKKEIKIKSEKRKKVPLKKEKELPFSSAQFIEQWNILLGMPKWKKKPKQSIDSTITQIAKYDEEFVITLINSAISNNWQGLLFPDTNSQFINWKKAKNNETHIEQSGSNSKNIVQNKEPERNYKERL
jgi:hypothetical protein